MVERRQLLKGLGGMGLGAVLAGCGVSTGDPAGAPKAPTFDFDLPDTGAKLPTAQTTIRWLNGGPGPKTYFFNEFNAAYQKKHPNIKIQYDELPNNKIAETLPIQLRNGDVADAFLVIDVPISELVAGNKLAALDDVIPNFGEWKKNVPFGTLVPGVQVFDGKTYAITPSSDRRSTLMLYNADYMSKAGLEPASKPFTWEEFRAAAKKLTEQGKGEYYGLILPQVFMGVVFDLAQLSGVRIADVRGDGIDWRTGEFNYHHDGVVALIELLLAIKSDGSLFPGWAALKDEQARARMAQGGAGMILSGPWNFPVWKEQNPDFKYGVARLPGPDKGYIPYAVGGSNQFAVYANATADRKAIAGDQFYFLGTDQGQRAWNRLTGAADPAWSSQAMKDIIGSSVIDEPNKAALKIFDQTVRLAPSPLVRNPANEKVELAFVAPKPNLGQVVQGILTGQVTDVRKALKDLSDKSSKALDDAIAKAKSQGASVSRDDWKFANWDPSKDFAQADYR